MILTFLKKHWFKLGLWVLVYLPIISFLIVNLVILTYMYWPQDYQQINFEKYNTPHEHLLVAAHGVEDNPKSWIEPLFAIYQQQKRRQHPLAVDWSTYAKDPLRCSIDGSRIGHRIGKAALKSKDIKSLHLIGHSCGAFVIYNICKAIKAEKPNVSIQTTYLDPVSIYGPRFNYGLKHFGGCGNYSEAYIDTGDNVMGSNDRLSLARTYNVTSEREKRRIAINPHLWPTAFYLELAETKQNPIVYSFMSTEEAPEVSSELKSLEY